MRGFLTEKVKSTQTNIVSRNTQRILRIIFHKKRKQKELTLLKSISGMDAKSVTFLLVPTEGFSNFETDSQLCSFVGITPTIRESGSSVRGRSIISKTGIYYRQKWLALRREFCFHTKLKIYRFLFDF